MKVEHVMTPQRREQLYRFYFDEWWTRDRTPDQADAALAASYLAFIIDDDDEVVGFARAVSDPDPSHTLRRTASKKPETSKTLPA